MTLQDHYAILGVIRTADGNSIKQAYRKLALKIHPDKNGGSQLAKEEFQKLQEAYECLSDPSKKRLYDLTTPAASSTKPSTSNTYTSSGSSYSNYSSGSYYAYQTPADLMEEENRFNEKWRYHTSQGKNLKTTLQSTKARIEEMQRKAAQAKREMENREEARIAKTSRSWLQKIVWGNAQLSQAEIDEKDKKDQENLQQINSFRIKIARLEAELKRIQDDQKEWQKQEGIRVREDQELKAKKVRRKAADEAERKRKAEEAARKAREKAEKERQEEERLERERWAREEVERIRKEAERQRKAAELRREAAERQRKAREDLQNSRKKAEDNLKRAREQARKEAEQQQGQSWRGEADQAHPKSKGKKAKQNRQKGTSSSTAAKCSHKAFWNKVTISSESCGHCQRQYHAYLFECPNCYTKACASCRDQLKGRPYKYIPPHLRATAQQKTDRWDADEDWTYHDYYD